MNDFDDDSYKKAMAWQPSDVVQLLCYQTGLQREDLYEIKARDINGAKLIQMAGNNDYIDYITRGVECTRKRFRVREAINAAKYTIRRSVTPPGKTYEFNNYGSTRLACELSKSKMFLYGSSNGNSCRDASVRRPQTPEITAGYERPSWYGKVEAFVSKKERLKTNDVEEDLNRKLKIREIRARRSRLASTIIKQQLLNSPSPPDNPTPSEDDHQQHVFRRIAEEDQLRRLQQIEREYNVQQLLDKRKQSIRDENSLSTQKQRRCHLLDIRIGDPWEDDTS